jgi:hypothetical protein
MMTAIYSAMASTLLLNPGPGARCYGSVLKLAGEVLDTPQPSLRIGPLKGLSSHV